MKITNKIYILLFFSYLFCIIPFGLKSQISIGGIPPSFEYNLSKSLVQTLNINQPDITQLLLEDEMSDEKGETYRMGILLPVNRGIQNSGTWTKLNNGDKIWQLRIIAKGALATSLYYDKFYLPKGSRLYVYNDDKTSLIGAFTNKNNYITGFFATELVAGDATTLEYYEPFSVTDTVIINISDINYAYRSVNIANNKYGFGASDPCEVNINCPEGNNWKLQKSGVARINTREGSSTGWCTGSLVNNTLQDYKPYFLTANHCGDNASSSDLSQWIFYFNYESSSCNNPSSEGNLATQSMAGATKLANAGTAGSDFLLLKLNNDVPETYNPYFNGWDRTEDPSISGVSIHHPAGDIKKISTYTTPLISCTNGNSVLSYWNAKWDSTVTGYGVTEGGSSGSPLFSSSGKLIGTLTSGPSSCSETVDNKYDFYGKFNWHWDKNGVTTAEKLKEWLDPNNSNIMQLDGLTYYKADFIADFNFIKVGESVNFINKSLGTPTHYLWNFEKGHPSISTDKNPTDRVLYSEAGIFDVSLQAFYTTPDSIFINKTTIKTDFIRVWGDIKIYTAPLEGRLWLDFNNNIIRNFSLSIYDVLGRNVLSFENKNNSQNKYDFNISNLRTGVYFVNIKTEATNQDKKIVIIN
ncbi:MAG: T9SS type A sorting domain-containing protein [Bacteroidetes bacterium]|nr:T9SS type A sorting domain-containing protein [Bacteroidota bacterium]